MSSSGAASPVISLRISQVRVISTWRREDFLNDIEKEDINNEETFEFEDENIEDYLENEEIDNTEKEVLLETLYDDKGLIDPEEDF